MTTMLEKVCRALCLEAGLDPDRKFKSANWGPETAPHEFAWQEYLPAARAALEAIREPPHELALIADDRVRISRAIEVDEGTDFFNALIDAILAEEPEATT